MCWRLACNTKVEAVGQSFWFIVDGRVIVITLKKHTKRCLQDGIGTMVRFMEYSDAQFTTWGVVIIVIVVSFLWIFFVFCFWLFIMCVWRKIWARVGRMGDNGRWYEVGKHEPGSMYCTRHFKWSKDEIIFGSKEGLNFDVVKNMGVIVLGVIAVILTCLVISATRRAPWTEWCAACKTWIVQYAEVDDMFKPLNAGVSGGLSRRKRYL